MHTTHPRPPAPPALGLIPTGWSVGNEADHGPDSIIRTDAAPLMTLVVGPGCGMTGYSFEWLAITASGNLVAGGEERTRTRAAAAADAHLAAIRWAAGR